MSDEKQQALFEAWADGKFGASPKLPQTERFASYWKCWQAALASQTKPEPVLLTYEEFIEAEESGARLFKLRPGVSGQQMTERDSIGWWVWRAIESAVLRKNGWGE